MLLRQYVQEEEKLQEENTCICPHQSMKENTRFFMTERVFSVLKKEKILNTIKLVCYEIMSTKKTI